MQQLGAIFKRCISGGFCQPTSDAEHLICQAEQARSSVLKFARSLSMQIGLDPDLNVEMGPIKTLERIWQKALGRKGGRVDLVTDICRERLKVESLDDVREIRRLFGPGRNLDFHKEWNERGISVLEIEDYFAQPNSRGFRALNMTLGVDLGKGRYHVCELQVIHRQMQETYDTTHAYYEMIRDLEELAKGQQRELSDTEKDMVKSLEAETVRLHHEKADQLELTQLEAPRLYLISRQETPPPYSKLAA